MADVEKEKSKKAARDLKSEAQRIAAQVKVEGASRQEIQRIAIGIQQGLEIALREARERQHALNKRSKKVVDREKALRDAEQIMINARNQLPQKKKETKIPRANLYLGLIIVGLLLYIFIS